MKDENTPNPADQQSPLARRLFQAEWWVENIQRTGWRKEQGTLRTIEEMRSWLEYHRFRMLRSLPETPIQGVVEIGHVENGWITDEQAEYLGGYWLENISGTIRLAAAVSSLGGESFRASTTEHQPNTARKPL